MLDQMRTKPIPQLLMTMSLPIMVAMFIQALYNIVDSMFVANYSKTALDAVSLAFPISMIIIALAVGTAVGMGALLAKRLGERRHEAANQTALHGIVLAILSWAGIALFGLFFASSFSSMFSSDPAIVAQATTYIRITTIFSFGVFVQIMMERMFQSTGHTVFNLMTQASGAIINIILDPILIFGLFGFPEMGIAGAAIATIIGQISAMIIGLVIINKKVKVISLDFKKWKPDMEIVKQIYRVGFPAIVMQSIFSLMTVGLNAILASGSIEAITVYGVYAKLQQFVFMPVFGMNSAMVAIIAYNYGAKQKKRINETIKLGLIVTTIIMLAGTILFQVASASILQLFNADALMLEIGIPALRIISLQFIVAGISIVLSAVFQALGKGTYSLFVSIVRNLVLLLPLCYVMYHAFGLPSMWFAFVISEFLGMIYALGLMRSVRKQIIEPLKEKTSARVVLQES
ncbi:MAG: MATE family efflux transporter [Erysipelotrichaceae bacterium]